MKATVNLTGAVNVTVAWQVLQEGQRVRVKAGDGRGDKGLGLSKGDTGGQGWWASHVGPRPQDLSDWAYISQQDDSRQAHPSLPRACQPRLWSLELAVDQRACG